MIFFPDIDEKKWHNWFRFLPTRTSDLFCHDPQFNRTTENTNHSARLDLPRPFLCRFKIDFHVEETELIIAPRSQIVSSYREDLFEYSFPNPFIDHCVQLFPPRLVFFRFWNPSSCLTLSIFNQTKENLSSEEQMLSTDHDYSLTITLQELCRGNSKQNGKARRMRELREIFGGGNDENDRLQSDDLREKSDRIRRRIRVKSKEMLVKEENVDGVVRHNHWFCLWKGRRRSSMRRVRRSMTFRSSRRTSLDRWEDKPTIRRWNASFNIESTEIFCSEEYRSLSTQSSFFSSLLGKIEEKTPNDGGE